MPRAALHNLGCKVNAYETEAMQQQLEEAGYEIVAFEETADVYVINTCSVTNIADRKSRQMLHRAKKRNPAAAVVAVGCYVQVAAETLKKDASVDLIIGNNQKGQLVRLLTEYFARRDAGGANETEGEIEDISCTREYEALHLSRRGAHTRAFIKVQDGCNQFCSYCIIPYARGRVRSRERADVVEEVKSLVAQGYREVVLTGIHLSSYGVEWMEENPVSRGDWNHRELLRLIQEVHAIPGLARLRLGSLEPRIITPEFAEELSRLPGFCPHFHLSLQSGCDDTLRRMNRHYTTEDYLRRCQILRGHFDHPAITTDVIVGFPGETEEEFAATKEFLARVRFYEMHVFKYSRREGTRAAAMENQIPPEIKDRRSDELLSLEAEMSEEYRRYYLGRPVEVLLEEETVLQGTPCIAGYTAEYIRVALPRPAASAGSLLSAVPDRLLSPDTLFASPLQQKQKSVAE